MTNMWSVKVVPKRKASSGVLDFGLLVKVIAIFGTGTALLANRMGFAQHPSGVSRAQGAKERADFLRQRLRLLPGGEMAAFGHHAPAADVGVHARRKRARRMEDLLGKLGVAHRHLDGAGNRPRPVHARIVGPEGRANRAGEPIETGVRQHVVARDRALGSAMAVGPRPHFLDDPRGKTRR